MPPFSSIRNVLLHPKSFWEQPGREERIGKTMIYALTLCCIGLAVSYVLMHLAPTELYPKNVTDLAAQWGTDAKTFVSIFIALSYPLSFVLLFVNAFFLSLVSRLFKSNAAFAVTYAITTHSATPVFLFSRIPVLSTIASPWMEVLKVLGIRQVQKVSTVKACLIVIIADILFGMTMLAIVLFFIFGFAAALITPGTTVQSTQSSSMRMEQRSSSSAVSSVSENSISSGTPAISSAGFAAGIPSDAQTYRNDAYRFSMNYPANWKVYETLPGGPNTEVYAADAIIELHRPLTEENRDLVLNGMRLAIYKNATLEDYLNHTVNTGTHMKRFRDIYTEYKTVKVQNFDGIRYDRIGKNMMTTQSLRSTVLQVGVHLFEIEIVAAEETEMEPYIHSLRLLNADQTKDDVASIFDPFPTEPLSIGQTTAPVTLTIFTDYTIGAAQGFFSTVFPTLDERYIQTGKVRFIIRQYPLGFNPSDKHLASMMECSRLQGEPVALAFHTALSTRRAPWENTFEDWLVNQAKVQPGLDLRKLTECDRLELSKKRIEQDMLLGKKKGVDGVPEFFLKNMHGEEQIKRGFVGSSMDDLFEKIDAFIGS